MNFPYFSKKNKVYFKSRTRGAADIIDCRPEIIAPTVPNNYPWIRYYFLKKTKLILSTQSNNRQQVTRTCATSRVFSWMLKSTSNGCICSRSMSRWRMRNNTPSTPPFDAVTSFDADIYVEQGVCGVGLGKVWEFWGLKRTILFLKKNNQKSYQSTTTSIDSFMRHTFILII